MNFNNSFESTFIENILSEPDESKREEIINQLKQHLYELENNNKIVDDLSNKFFSLQEEFKSLSLSKKQIEFDLNSKINNLESEKEILNNKYISSKNQIKNIIGNYSKEINDLKSLNEILKVDNENLQKENKKLIQQISLYKKNEEIMFYQEKLDEANSSIMKLNNIIKDLEDKNEENMNKLFNNDFNSGNNKEIIIGLRKIIEEKEGLITNLYNSYDKVSIKYEDLLKKNDKLKKEISSLKNQINTIISQSQTLKANNKSSSIIIEENPYPIEEILSQNQIKYNYN
jgi:chromosome segregation ATPase